MEGYFLRDPSVTFDEARQAAIRQMKASRALDERFHTGIPDSDKVALRRLETLGIDPITLQEVQP